MSLFNPIFLSLLGDQAPGRKPPNLRIDGGSLTDTQVAIVAGTFGEYHRALAVSLTPNFGRMRRVLSDGTIFEIETIAGQDYVRLQPPLPESSGGLFEYFRGVPTSTSLPDGADGSHYWRFFVSDTLTDFPPEFPYAGDSTPHAGHVTWSNPDYTFGGAPMVVSWHGPRDRYSASTGWSTFSGGSIVAHEAGALAADVFKDNAVVYIDGKRIITPVAKIIAACLHQWDPVDHPGQFVVRVCTDRSPVGGFFSNTRKLSTVDLVATDGAAGSTLDELAEADALFVKATYPVGSDFDVNLGGGKWDIRQRPHFNASGDKLAAIIYWQTTLVLYGAVFDAVTWAHTKITTDASVHAPVSSSSVVHTYATDSNGVEYIARSFFSQGRSVQTNTRRLLAVDFEADTPVHVWVENDELRVTARTDDSAGPMTSNIETTTNTRVKHSRLGTLLELPTDVVTQSYAVDSGHTGNGGTTASTSRTIAFIGDLSKAAFAIGNAKGQVVFSGTNVYGGGTVTITSTQTPERLKYDVWLDGSKAAADTTGGFANDPATPVTTVTSGPDGLFNPANPGGSASDPLPAVDTTTDYFVAAGTNSGAFSGCAVRATRQAAYFAARVPGTAGLSGLELGVFKVANTPASFELAAPPAYASGARPTITAPVFTGPSTKATP